MGTAITAERTAAVEIETEMKVSLLNTTLSSIRAFSSMMIMCGLPCKE